MLRAQVSKDRFRVATPARPSPDPAENLKLAFIPGGRPPDKNLRLAVSISPKSGKHSKHMVVDMMYQGMV